MDEKEHFERLNRYYEKSKICFDVLLWGSKNFGFYPKNKKISEKTAQLLMQDLVAKKLNLKKSMKVLDAGCGQGVASVYIANKFGCKIEGITVVPFEIDEARLLAKRINLSHLVNYSFMDYSNMTFENDMFDAIYTTGTLSHAIDIRKTLKEFFRVLKKGGKIALFEYTIAEDNKFSGYEMNMLDTVIHASAMDGLKEFRHDKFQSIIKGIGLKKVKVENISENTKPSFNRLRKFFIIPYFIIKLFGLQKYFPNATAAVEYYKMSEKGLIRYNIFTAEK